MTLVYVFLSAFVSMCSLVRRELLRETDFGGWSCVVDAVAPRLSVYIRTYACCRRCLSTRTWIRRRWRIRTCRTIRTRSNCRGRRRRRNLGRIQTACWTTDRGRDVGMEANQWLHVGNLWQTFRFDWSYMPVGIVAEAARSGSRWRGVGFVINSARARRHKQMGHRSQAFHALSAATHTQQDLD